MENPSGMFYLFVFINWWLIYIDYEAILNFFRFINIMKLRVQIRWNSAMLLLTSAFLRSILKWLRQVTVLHLAYLYFVLCMIFSFFSALLLSRKVNGIRFKGICSLFAWNCVTSYFAVWIIINVTLYAVSLLLFVECNVEKSFSKVS